MAVRPISSLLISMGIPMMISMALQAVYNIVDSYFVSTMKDTETITGMGDYAVNALTLAFPVQMLMVAVGVGTGVGINSLLSRSIGEGNREKAAKISGNAIFLGLCTFIVFFLFGLFASKAYVATQTSDPIISDMAVSYLRICCVWSFGIIMYTIIEKLLQSTGRSVQTTIAQVAGALVNIILDPILIFGWLGLPEMGIDGAAYATVIGQFVSFFLNLIFHIRYNKKEFDTSLRYMKPQKKVIADIYRVGIPAIIMQALMSFMTYGVNVIFVKVSASAVTAYGVYYKIQQFVFFAALGMNNAMIPLIAFNYGMGDKKRVNKAISLGIVYTVGIMGIGMLALELLEEPIVGIFTLTDKTKALCVTAVRVCALGYLFIGGNVAYQGIFQALGSGVRSLIVSLLRLIVIALPLAYLLAVTAPKLIWWAFPIAELGALICAVLMMRRVRAQLGLAKSSAEPALKTAKANI